MWVFIVPSVAPQAGFRFVVAEWDLMFVTLACHLLRSGISELRTQIRDLGSEISDQRCQIRDLRSEISDLKSLGLEMFDLISQIGDLMVTPNVSSWSAINEASNWEMLERLRIRKSECLKISPGVLIGHSRFVMQCSNVRRFEYEPIDNSSV